MYTIFIEINSINVFKLNTNFNLILINNLDLYKYCLFNIYLST